MLVVVAVVRMIAAPQQLGREVLVAGEQVVEPVLE